MESLFESLDKVTTKNLIEYIYHASMWAKNHENVVRLSKMQLLLEKDDQLRHFLEKHVFEKEYRKLWAGSYWKIKEDSYVPKVNDVVRREDNPQHVWTQRKSQATRMANYNKAESKPDTGGIIVRTKKPIMAKKVIMDAEGLTKLLNTFRKNKNQLRDVLSEKLGEDYDNDYMYRIFNAARLLRPIADRYEVVTEKDTDMAKVVAQYKHNKGLMETDGDWRTNKKTEII